MLHTRKVKCFGVFWTNENKIGIFIWLTDIPSLSVLLRLLRFTVIHTYILFCWFLAFDRIHSFSLIGLCLRLCLVEENFTLFSRLPRVSRVARSMYVCFCVIKRHVATRSAYFHNCRFFFSLVGGTNMGFEKSLLWLCTPTCYMCSVFDLFSNFSVFQTRWQRV